MPADDALYEAHRQSPRIMDAGIHRSTVAATTAGPRADAGFGKGLSINYMDRP